MQSPKVSVVVPVYNVSPYIEKCARSLFEQTLDDLEIIFVDDCSPDDSVNIIQEVLRDFPNRKSYTYIVKMAHNSGQAAVRKKGIEEATGEYIIHCDGDDWVDRELYEKLYLIAKDNDADIAVCDEIQEFHKVSLIKSVGTLPSSGKELMKNWYGYSIGLFCHNKLVRRTLYIENKIYPWEGLNMWEDNGLFARLFYYAQKVVQLKGGPVYHYNRTNVNAMTAGYGEKQVDQMIGIATNLADFFESKPDGVEFEKTVNAFKYLARINLITDSYKRYSRFRKTFPESRPIATELDRGAFSRKGKIRFLMVKNGAALLFISLFKLRKLIFK